MKRALLLFTSLLALILGLPAGHAECGALATGDTCRIAMQEDAGKIQFDSDKGLCIRLQRRDAGARIFTLELLVIANPDRQNFLINICSEKNCRNPKESIISAFSFFPAPDPGTRNAFTFYVTSAAYPKALEEIYISIEKLVDTENSPPITLQMTEFEEQYTEN